MSAERHGVQEKSLRGPGERLSQKRFASKLATPAQTGQEAGKSSAGKALHDEQHAEKNGNVENRMARGFQHAEGDKGDARENIESANAEAGGWNHVPLPRPVSHNRQGNAGRRHGAARCDYRACTASERILTVENQPGGILRSGPGRRRGEACRIRSKGRGCWWRAGSSGRSALRATNREGNSGAFR